MKYRKLGNTGIEVSALGFGCMRLPRHEKTGKINEQASLACFRRAAELGVNYFDSAYIYDNGDSERVLGKFVKEIERENIIITTKSYVGHAWVPIKRNKSTRDLWVEGLEEQLKRLQSEYIDCYLFHDTSLTAYRILYHGNSGLILEALKAKEQGLIRHIGISSHDTPDNIISLLKMAGDAIELIIVQYNLLDRKNLKVLDYASDNNIGVAVMGPIAGGRLSGPSTVYKGLAGASGTSEIALRFVLSNQAVSIAMSGMNTIKQVEENAATVSKDTLLTAEESQNIDDIQKNNEKLLDLYCTGCKYCMPCPHNINIPGSFSAMNVLKVHGLLDVARSQYESLSEGKASECAHCSECAGKCPQGINIEEKLAEVALAFG